MTGAVYLEAVSLNKREASIPLLRPPASIQVGVSDNTLLVKSRIEVKDDVIVFNEVNMEPAKTRDF